MPRLIVTGIAWQNDSTVHFAVVNGQSVTEGSTVEGARVEKIFPDRVSFSCQNKTMEVPLSQ
jgi:general secretion pathway protein B